MVFYKFNIVFFVLALFPYHSIKVNTIGMTESDSKIDTYRDSWILFSTDYEKLSPFTRKSAYINYFSRLINKKIIDRYEGERIIENLENTNEMAGYLKTKRHLDYYCASQQLNYIKNKKFNIN